MQSHSHDPRVVPPPIRTTEVKVEQFPRWAVALVAAALGFLTALPIGNSWQSSSQRQAAEKREADLLRQVAEATKKMGEAQGDAARVQKDFETCQRNWESLERVYVKEAKSRLQQIDELERRVRNLAEGYMQAMSIVGVIEKAPVVAELLRTPEFCSRFRYYNISPREALQGAGARWFTEEVRKQKAAPLQTLLEIEAVEAVKEGPNSAFDSSRINAAPSGGVRVD